MITSRQSQIFLKFFRAEKYVIISLYNKIVYDLRFRIIYMI